jgi:hypothetical protein
MGFINNYRSFSPGINEQATGKVSKFAESSEEELIGLFVQSHILKFSLLKL